MSIRNDNEFTVVIHEMTLTGEFSKLFNELDGCNEEGQRQKIVEMNRILEEMNEKEFISIYTTELLNRIDKMMKRKKVSLENSFLLLTRIGYCKGLVGLWSASFYESSLYNRLNNMIFIEARKIEGKNENLLISLCECYILLLNHYWKMSKGLLFKSVNCIIKAELSKKEDEKTQKEVEITLLALSRIDAHIRMKEDIYSTKIAEIIKYHQEHHNLTQLAYQSAWEFLMVLYKDDKCLERLIVNELHFVREATRELEELMGYVDWKKSKKAKRGKEMKDIRIIERWLDTIYIIFLQCRLSDEEFIRLASCVKRIFRAASDNHRGIRRMCIRCYLITYFNRAVKNEALLNGGAVDVVLEEITQFDIDNLHCLGCLSFFKSMCERLKTTVEPEEKRANGKEMRRKALKMEIFEKMEEEGYEDYIFGLFHCLVNGTDDLFILFENLNDCFVCC
ncbi:uncharacterized protein MONOS_17878 [Monocercomonoides exilis]|uniref:uncharacterized protein n=1 Tax=Monocercomonoides exilis TaxID=2049356 RepID=UPI00355999C6|nr:hypothetical protein MONOS_17878 [Monocercomonoides exilis]